MLVEFSGKIIKFKWISNQELDPHIRRKAINIKETRLRSNFTKDVNKIHRFVQTNQRKFQNALKC